MTLRQIRTAHPALFHANQDWFNDEPFMDRDAEPLETLPTFQQWGFPYLFPHQDSQRVSASSLALLYVAHPNAEIWDEDLITDDLDSAGQRVFVGGKRKGHGFEIHRVLTLGSHFGLPRWE